MTLALKTPSAVRIMNPNEIIRLRGNFSKRGWNFGVLVSKKLAVVYNSKITRTELFIYIIYERVMA
jgi:hypothetical protein